MMVATIRSYRITNADELFELVREEFVPIVETVPGFVAYYVLDTGVGTATSITVCATKEGLHESAARAAAWVEERALDFIESGPEVLTGEVVAEATPVELAA
jgi:hypothetical protein